MTALLILYWPTIIAASLSAAALSVAGAFLITRHAGVQILAVSQSAGFGVSIGLLIVTLFFQQQHIEHTILPLLSGLVISGLSFILTNWLANRSHSPTSVYLAAFGFFWGITQLFTGIFPIVESHATALYFGDIVTLTQNESIFFMALSTIIIAYLLKTWRLQADRAFRFSILEEPLRFKFGADLGFYLTSLVLICFSVQLLGLLFTLSSLFIPTAIYSYSRSTGVSPHLIRVGASAFMAAMLGFFLSLLVPQLLTSPIITVFLTALPIAHIAAERHFFNAN